LEAYRFDASGFVGKSQRTALRESAARVRQRALMTWPLTSLLRWRERVL